MNTNGSTNCLGTGLSILMETMRRLQAGIYGGNTAPQHLIKSCWDDGGYNIDAPSSIPAGGCHWLEVDEEGGLPEQMMVERE